MIERLQARRFRNLVDLDVHFSPGVHFLFGDTGHGKTSVLEALYVLATSRSFRTAKLEHCATRPEMTPESPESHESPESPELSESSDGQRGFWLRAEVLSDEVRSELEISWQARSPQALQRWVNSTPATVGEYLAVQSVVVWSSADLETLVGPPALRRRLLDRGVVARHPAALQALGTYRRALEHKRSLLFQPRVDRDQVRGINELLATAGAEIMRRRREYAASLAAAFALASTDLGFSWGNLRLAYRAKDHAMQQQREPAGQHVERGAAGHSLEASDAAEPSVDERRDAGRFLAALDEVLEREIERRRPLLGPHLDEVEFEWRGLPLSQIASAGERKALGLLLTLAQVRLLRRVDRTPLLLLDDLDTELDEVLIGRFAPLLRATDQAFVTSNRPGVFEGLKRGLEESTEPTGGSREGDEGRFSWILQSGRLGGL